MLKNYFIVALRNMRRNPAHAFINVAGLSVGMAVSMLIGLWIWDELSFNSYNKNYDTIAQVDRKEVSSGEIFKDGDSWLPIPLSAEIRNSYGNVFRQVALAQPSSDHVLAVDDHAFSREGMYVEPGFTEMFTLKMLAGKSSYLHEPNTILLSRSLAGALFGKGEAVGKTIKMDNAQSLKVTGVYEDLPRNTRFAEASFFCPWDLLVQTQGNVKNNVTNWGNSSFKIYVQTTPGVDIARASEAIRQVYWSKMKADFHTPANFRVDLFLNPMMDWHLRSQWKNGVQAGGGIEMVWLFGVIGIFVLLLACINFMNLSTARSEKRAKEIGIRKTIGSLRSQLVKQFLSESFLVVILAFAVSIGMVWLSLGWFNTVANKKISFPSDRPVFWILSALFICLTALVAGSYPAIYLSSFQPVKVLKGTFRAGRLAAIPRRVMVAVQFTVSILLIIGTLVVHRQIQHAQYRPVGYDKSGLIWIRMRTPDLYGKYDVLQKALLESGGATGFAQSSSAPTHVKNHDGNFEWPGKDPNYSPTGFGVMGVTYEFGKTIGWQFVAGRDFSKDYPTDDKAIVFNEEAIKYMGLKDPVGQTIKWNGKPYTIIGVTRDMVTESPYSPALKTAATLALGVGPNILIRLNPKLSAGNAIRKIEPIFKTYNPSSPFEFAFVDEEYGRKFAAEQSIGTLATFFASLAIFISCLGIFGMASFIAERRTREIGVRKVLGASVINLWGLLSKEFVVLVIVAFLVAAPAADYFMNQWLLKYDYHTDIPWWIFAVAGSGALLITLLTSSYQGIKAALVNPVKSLRSE